MPVNSIDLHFVHEQSPNEHAIPLILIHGWPGSILEFTELIPKLTNPGECLCETRLVTSVRLSQHYRHMNRCLQ